MGLERKETAQGPRWSSVDSQNERNSSRRMKEAKRQRWGNSRAVKIFEFERNSEMS